VDYQKDMLVADLVNAHPLAKDVLLEFGLPCHECIVAWHETLEEGLRPHGIPVDDVLLALKTNAPLKGKKAVSEAGPKSS